MYQLLYLWSAQWPKTRKTPKWKEKKEEEVFVLFLCQYTFADIKGQNKSDFFYDHMYMTSTWMNWVGCEKLENLKKNRWWLLDKKCID